MTISTEERRHISYSATLDSAIRSASQLFSSKDAMTRSSANRVIADLQKMRGTMPARRQDDNNFDVRR